MKFENKRLPLQLAATAVVLIFAAAVWHHYHDNRRLPYEQCMQACTLQQNCDLNFASGPHSVGGNCFIVQNQCMTQCGGGMPPPSIPLAQTVPGMPFERGPYGALAYDKDSGAWGLADASRDEKSAAESALGFCSSYGQHCAIADRFSGTCAAVATGGKNAIAWAKDKESADAKAAALANCAKKAKTSCILRIVNCYPQKS